MMTPIMFIGHGNPMNAIEDNEYTSGWESIAESIPLPTAILVISAHWSTKGTKVSVVEQPRTIHDFYGFPQELHEVNYPADGSPFFAKRTIELLGDEADSDDTWGLDHGTWSVLKKMYPKADVPVDQMSIDMYASPEELFSIGERLKPLREEGVMILGSGNVVHNLGYMNFAARDGFDWAREFDDYMETNIKMRDFQSLFDYKYLYEISSLAVPTTEHLYPLFCILGCTDEDDQVTVYNKLYDSGSLSMTSYVFEHIKE